MRKHFLGPTEVLELIVSILKGNATSIKCVVFSNNAVKRTFSVEHPLNGISNSRGKSDLNSCSVPSNARWALCKRNCPAFAAAYQ